MKLHTDYIADLALVEVPTISTGEDSDQNMGDFGAHFGDCSVLTASTDKTIRLTPFSFLDMEFA